MGDTLVVTDKRYADIRFQDGALPHAVGVHSWQILRANREHPELADGHGWTYNHAAMLAYYHGKLFCEYLSNPVSEHEVPGQTLLTYSDNGADWAQPFVVFPVIEVPTAQYKGPRSPELLPRMLSVPHHRVGFYVAKNDVLLVLSFYGIVHDRHMSMPCDGWGVGRVVRRVYPDGTVGDDICFLKYNEVAGYTRENTGTFAYFEESGDADFVAACRELLQNRPVIQQMYEEQRFDRDFIPFEGKQALSYYSISPQEMVGVFKRGLSSISRNGGETWAPITENPTVRTATGKVWGQKTSDGRFALLYNSTTDGQHRWPIAIVTGEDGHTFGGMLAVTGFMSPLRYGGLDKNLGPQYMRGICEANPQTPDGDIWLVYSQNKEDIWISRIPVPVKGAVEGPVAEDFAGMADGPYLPGWNIYSPLWAKVRLEGGALVLRDADRYDRAVAERAVAASVQGEVSFEASVDALREGTCLAVDLQADDGSVPVQVTFQPDGRVYVREGGRSEPWTDYPMGQRLAVTVAYDCHRNHFAVRMDGKEKKTAFSASVGSVCRAVFATKTLAQLPLDTTETVGKYGTREQVLPEAGERQEEAQVRLFAFSATDGEA